MMEHRELVVQWPALLPLRSETMYFWEGRGQIGGNQNQLNTAKDLEKILDNEKHKYRDTAIYVKVILQMI
jgi:hypothetical protein